MHSYLIYLRDRLILCRELLADTGSIFVQIGDENLHHIIELMDEVFGEENRCSIIAFKKMSGLGTFGVGNVLDFLVWYAKSKDKTKIHELKEPKLEAEHVGVFYDHVELSNGERRRFLRTEFQSGPAPDAKVFQGSVLYSEGSTQTGQLEIELEGQRFAVPRNAHWKTNSTGLQRLLAAGRVFLKGNTPRYVRYLDDYLCYPLTNVWTDTGFGGFVGDQSKIYVVQTSSLVIARCLLMTTDPGDLVLDPTCGSGTTAYVAEQWRRRWITIDTSRVALALARQRLLTARFDYYKLKDEARGVAGGFVCKTVPHITLRSIAQNVALDAIFAKHQPVLDEKLKALNDALRLVTPELRQRLRAKLLEKEKRKGKKALTDADRRRWLLPAAGGASPSPLHGERAGVRGGPGTNDEPLTLPLSPKGAREAPSAGASGKCRLIPTRTGRRRCRRRCGRIGLRGGRRWTRSTHASPPMPSRTSWWTSRRSCAAWCVSAARSRWKR